jgi:hypothetical protein
LTACKGTERDDLIVHSLITHDIDDTDGQQRRVSLRDDAGLGRVVAGPLPRPINELSKMNRFPPTPVPPAPMAGTLGSCVEPLFCLWLLAIPAEGRQSCRISGLNARPVANVDLMEDGGYAMLRRELGNSLISVLLEDVKNDQNSSCGSLEHH